MDSNDNFVKVTIYGQEYTIKAPADASYIKNIRSTTKNALTIEFTIIQVVPPVFKHA